MRAATDDELLRQIRELQTSLRAAQEQAGVERRRADRLEQSARTAWRVASESLRPGGAHDRRGP